VGDEGPEGTEDWAGPPQDLGEVGDEPSTPAPSPRRRRRRRRRILLGILAVVIVWIVLSAVDVLFAARHVQDGANQVQQAKNALSANGLLSGAPLSPLKAAQASFAAANNELSSPLLWPVDVLPVLGRQLRSVQDLSRAAGQVSHTGVGAVRQARALLKLPHTAGPDRIAALHKLTTLAATTHAALSHVNLGPSNNLIGPLGRERTKFATELSQVQTTLARTAAAASAAATILQGPQTYLLLTANNAEMRSGSGAFLEAGTISTAGGALHLNGLKPTSALTLSPGQVPVTGDLEARWGFLLPGVDWRNLGLTPQFDVNGALAARMWQADTSQKVDGVLALDVTGLQELLTVTGPLQTSNGTTVSADNVDQLLLHDQYIGEGYDTTSLGIEASRVDELGSLASAVMNALETKSLDLHAVANALSQATEGRHLMLWSADPATEAIWRSTGVSGRLTADSLVANVINRGGNKLDQYLSVQSSLQLTTQGTSTHATLTLHLANHTPSGQSPFIAGPYPGLGTSYGEYVGIVTVNLPDYATGLSLVQGESAEVDGQEGPTLLAGVDVALLPGQSQDVTFHFDLPGVHGQVRVVPSGRIPPVAWSVNGSALGGHPSSFDDAASHTIVW
jgi:hypothetical protein